MKGLLTVLALAGICATAQAASTPMRTVGHVKRLERHNKFGLKQRIGGPFTLGATVCGAPNGDTVSTPGVVRCRWDATAVSTVDGSSGQGFRTVCTVEVRVRETKRHRTKSWRRHVVACAKQLTSAP